MRFAIFASVFFLTIAACEEDLTADEQARMPNEDQIRIAAESTNQSINEVREFYYQCVKEGGRGIIGGAGQPSCEKKTPDAGKSCSKESDCEGFCLAETKTCSSQSPFFGCHEVLTEEGQVVTVCVD